MAFLQNWRVRWVQQLVSWLGIPDHLLLVSWPLQKAASVPPHPASKPNFTCLFPSADPHSLWACLCLSLLSSSVPSCTPTHRYTKTHTQPPKHSLLSTCRAEWLPWGLAISFPPSFSCSDCLHFKLQNRGAELTHTSISLPHIFLSHAFLRVLPCHLPSFFK